MFCSVNNQHLIPCGPHLQLKRNDSNQKNLNGNTWAWMEGLGELAGLPLWHRRGLDNLQPQGRMSVNYRIRDPGLDSRLHHT